MSAPAASGPRLATSIEALLDAMERLPSQGNIALRVMWMADDPTTTLTGLARAVDKDPVLVARLLHLANSAYYSPRSPISTSDRAITLLGFATVRTIATVVACGLGSAAAVPHGFWQHAAATANAAQLIAWRFGIPTGDAFTVGLLHDLGRGLLHVADPGQSAAIELRLANRVPDEPQANRLELELGAFGITHAGAAARVLEAWRFPAAIVDAIAHHHDNPDAPAAQTARMLIAAEAVAEQAFGPWGEPGGGAPALALLALEPERLDAIIARVRTESGTLAAVLGR